MSHHEADPAGSAEVQPVSDANPPIARNSPIANGKKSSRRIFRIVGPAAVLLIAAALVFLKRGAVPTAESPVVSIPGASPAVLDLLQDLRSRVERQPDSASAWGDYGLCLMQHERPREALTCFQQALQRESDNPAWHYLSGVILEQTSLEQAVAALQRTIELRRDSAVARLRLASALMTLGQLQQASEHLEQVRSQLPGAAEGWVQGVRIARLSGQPELAESLLAEARRVQAVTSVLLREVASAALQRGRGEVAASLLDEATRAPLPRPLPDPWLERSRAFDVSGAVASQQADQQRQQGLLDQAVRTLSTLSRRFPERSRPTLNLALALREQGRIAEAVSELEQLTTRFPADPLVRFHLAVTLAQTGQTEMAMQHLNTCLTQKSDYGMARAVLGDLLDSQGQVDAAIAAYQRAVTDSPEEPWIRFGFVELLLRHSRNVAAAEQLVAASLVVDGDQTAAQTELKRLQSLVDQHKPQSPPPSSPTPP